MSNNENTTDVTKSHSQEKRETRRKEVAQAKRRTVTLKVVGYAVLAVIVALIAWGIATLIIKEDAKVQQSDDYSAGLDANGYISGVNASSKVTLPTYKGVEIPYSEIEYTDAKIDADIESLMAGYEELSEDEGLKVSDGDKVNISYSGSIDGELFDRGQSDSYDLEIGSGTFIDTFEEQLIGADNGSEVIVNVTFPDDYSTTDLAGKPAEFVVNIKGIYVTPEFTDEFVQENLSDYASTVEEYRTYLKDISEADNKDAWLTTYLKENSTVNSYPRKYVKQLKSIQKYDDLQSYQYMNEMYQSYLGYSYYNSFEDYIGMSEADYDISLQDKCKEICKENMVYQAIVELEGAVADADYYKAYLAGIGYDNLYYASEVETAGEPFVLQQAIKLKALEIVADNAVVK